MKSFKVATIIIAVFILLTGFTNNNIEENNIFSKKPMTVEELYKSMGYIKAKKAITNYENQFNTKIKLPSLLPFRVSLGYGKIKNDKLILAYFGENKKDLFKLKVELNSEPIPKVEQKNKFKLDNGDTVFIREIGPNPKRPSVRLLYLNKDEIQYTLSINNLERNDTNTLLKVAESIN